MALNVYFSFNALDEILKSPPEQVQRSSNILGQENVRVLLRYAAGIENGSTFESWEEIQLCIGVLAMTLLFLESSTRVLSTVPLAMVLLVLFLHFKITPDMEWFHRQFAFSAWTAESKTRDQFWRLHGIYELIEVVKNLFGVMLALALFFGERSRRSRKKRHREGDDVSGLQRDIATR